MSTTRSPPTRSRDPLVDDEVALVPVVLLRHVGQRALAGERQRRDARRLVALEVERWRRACGARANVLPSAAPLCSAPCPTPAAPRGDPRRQHALPRRRRRRLRRQVGHRLRRDRPGARCSASCARRSAAAWRAFDARAGDRRRHRLLLAEPRCRPASSARRRAPTSRRACSRRCEAQRRPARASSVETVACDAERAAVRGRRPSTSCSATPSCTTCPTSTRAFREFRRVLRPGRDRCVFAGEPSRYGDRIAAYPKRAAGRASRRCGGG